MLFILYCIRLLYVAPPICTHSFTPIFFALFVAYICCLHIFTIFFSIFDFIIIPIFCRHQFIIFTKFVDCNKQNDDSDDNGDDDDKEDEKEEDEEENKLEKGNFFGYVDENGNVVYVDLEEEDNVVIFPSQIANNSADITGLIKENDMSAVDETVTIESNTKMEISNNDISLKSVSLSLTEINPITETSNTEMNKTNKIDKTDKNGKPLKNEKSEKHGFKKNVSTVIAPVVITNLSKYFLDRVDPSPRINPCLMVRNDISVLVLFVMFVMFILLIF